MTKALGFALTLFLAACVVGNGDPLPSGGGDDTGGGGGGGGGGTGSGSDTGGGGTTITADTAWTGAMTFTSPVTIAAGATVTAMPGADIQFGPTASLTINGTLNTAGITGAGNMVTLEPMTGNTSFGGIQVAGNFTATYTNLTGAELETMTGGVTTVNDSAFSHSPGDLLIMSGGSVTFMYSIVGSATGTGYQQGDTTHCDMHFGGTGNTIKVSHSIVTTSAYGVMFYAGTGADFTYNNWSKNTTNIDPETGVSGDFSNGYFDTAPPMVAGLTYNTLATSPLLACVAGGATDPTCAGPHP
jgi:hypothetical protein